MSDHLLSLSAQIVSAHVANNSLAPERVSDLITTVYATLRDIDLPPAVTEPPVPAVPVKKSVFPDYIICLEDGRRMKMLRRHLKTAYNMTPEEYRRKWGLPNDYPMVAPSYAAHRSNLAKEIGLGYSRSRSQEPVVTKIAKGVSSRRKRTRASA